MAFDDLRNRSARTLAWLGDAEFEREVRRRVAQRGDHPTERLDAIKARIVRAESQAELLALIEHDLTDDERAVVRRARNATPGSSARRRTRAYRAASALEALVATWLLGDAAARKRFERLLGDALERAIDDAVARTRKPKRG